MRMPRITSLTFTYSKEARYSYTVHYVDAQTGEQIHSDDIIGSQTLNLQNVSAREIDGYTLQGDSTGYVSADQLEYTFYYTKNPEAPAAPQTPAKRKSSLPETGDASSVALVGTALTSVVALGTSLFCVVGSVTRSKRTAFNASKTRVPRTRVFCLRILEVATGGHNSTIRKA